MSVNPHVLSPLNRNHGDAMHNVALWPGTYSAGTLLGELVAYRGIYAAYNPFNTDGTQLAKCILARDVVVDTFGNVTYVGEAPQVHAGSPAYIGGGAIFDTTRLVGLDQNAMSNLHASLIKGTISAGQLRY